MSNGKAAVQYGKVFLVVMVGLSLLGGSLSGCAPLRKKFVRQKKKDSEKRDFIPVLEPEDYPVKEYSAKERYEQHYALWKVWQKDLSLSIFEKQSDKRQQYLLTQAIEQLEQMKMFLADEGQKKLSVVIGDLYAFQKEYQKPASMRRSSSMRRKLESNASVVRESFSSKLPLVYKE